MYPSTLMHSSPTLLPASRRPAARLSFAPMRLLLLGLLLFVLTAPLCAAGNTWYVSPSGNDNNAGTTQAAPFKTIQQGFNNAVSGDTVMLEDGTYTGPMDVDLDFAGKNITVNSVNGAASTTIDCGGNATSNPQVVHRAFRMHNGETNAVISGLTIKNGYENSGYGGAVDIENGSTVTLTNCTLSGNSATTYPGQGSDPGGSIYSRGTVTLMGCTLTGNTGGGILSGGMATVTNCTVKNTVGDGVSNGGHYIEGGTMHLTACTLMANTGSGFSNVGNFGTAILAGCTLTGNTGGGVHCSGVYHSTTLTACSISGNSTSEGGGIYNYGGSVTLIGCTLSGNTAQNGGGFYSGSSSGGLNTSITLNGCTLSGNKATTGNGGGGDNYSSSPTNLTNCLLIGNTAPSGNGGGVDNESNGGILLQFCTFSTNSAGTQGGALENDGTATLKDDILWSNTAPNGAEIGTATSGNPVTTVTYSDIQGGLSGNIHADPLFVSATDFHLKAGSPCIGAGTPITGITTDLDGKTRANPPTIGCYEGAEAVAVTSHTHLLWNNTDGRVMLWSIDSAGNVTLNGFGPYTDNGPANIWHATALATGADGKNHIVWNNTDGRVMLWTVDDSGNFSLAGYGPYTDNGANNKWSAVAVSVGPDNTVHLLWSNTDHRAMLWSVDSAFNFSLAGYGPYTDNAPQNLWTATAMATGPDNVTRILWGNTDHRAMLWNVDSAFNFSLAGYGPYTDNAPQNLWDAVGVSVGPDSLPHLLWNNTDRRAMLWNLDGGLNLTGLSGYGPYTDNAPQDLWTVIGLAAGPDGMSHLLWNNTDNRAMLWGVDNAFNFTVAGYGPYTDNAPGNLWSVTAVSAGP